MNRQVAVEGGNYLLDGESDSTNAFAQTSHLRRVWLISPSLDRSSSCNAVVSVFAECTGLE